MLSFNRLCYHKTIVDCFIIKNRYKEDVIKNLAVEMGHYSTHFSPLHHSLSLHYKEVQQWVKLYLPFPSTHRNMNILVGKWVVCDKKLMFQSQILLIFKFGHLAKKIKIIHSSGGLSGCHIRSYRFSRQGETDQQPWSRRQCRLHTCCCSPPWLSRRRTWCRESWGGPGTPGPVLIPLCCCTCRNSGSPSTQHCMTYYHITKYSLLREGT